MKLLYDAQIPKKTQRPNNPFEKKLAVILDRVHQESTEPVRQYRNLNEGMLSARFQKAKLKDKGLQKTIKNINKMREYEISQRYSNNKSELQTPNFIQANGNIDGLDVDYRNQAAMTSRRTSAPGTARFKKREKTPQAIQTF